MPLLEQMGRDNLDGIVRTVRENGMEVDLEETGVLKLAVEPHQIEWIRDRGHNDDHIYLDQAQLRAEIRSPTHLSGLWDKRGNIMVHPGKLVAELARYAASLGVEIHEESR